LEYQRTLEKWIDAMNKSTLYWLTAAYRANEPRTVAQDIRPTDMRPPANAKRARRQMPAKTLQRRVRELAAFWQEKFDAMALEMSEWFTKSVDQRTTTAVKTTFAKAGFTVKPVHTPAQRDILQATVAQNIELIKSIPAENFADIQGMVMRSIQTGRDLQQLTGDLQKHFGVTRRRAVTIARDQNNKATSALMAAKQKEQGIEEGIWLHSHGGNTPRPKHVKADGQRFKIGVGLPVGPGGKYVVPGEEINCRCVWKPIIPGF
jgi:SPP1 gp7 family putative phage head morphogenesis protein